MFKKSKILTDACVVISGGSKGIGKSLAIQFSELGANVTIIARNKADLNAAKIEIEKARKNSSQVVRCVALDLVTLTFPDDSTNDTSNYRQKLLKEILGEKEKCDVLVNCCGSSIAAQFEDISEKQFRYLMDVNYFSAVNLTRLILPTMKRRSLAPGAETCHIVFVSSMCGLMSFFGYSAYSASKFAIVGLAEGLHMELRPHNIGVTVSFPPDTDTPGYEEENKTKPTLTMKMSESGNVYSPQDVASSIIEDMIAKKFYSTVGLENRMVLSSVNTFMPVSSVHKLLFDCILAGPLKLVGYFILKSWNKMVDEAALTEVAK